MTEPGDLVPMTVERIMALVRTLPPRSAAQQRADYLACIERMLVRLRDGSSRPLRQTWCTQNGIRKDVKTCTDNIATCECGTLQHRIRTRGVTPAFDATQPCLLTTPDPTRTVCLRCKNPHHACDGGGVKEDDQC